MSRLDPLFIRARAASRQLPELDRPALLAAMAEAVRQDTDAILEANALDVDAAVADGVSAALVDRLRLDSGRLAAIADAVDEVAALPDPLNRVLRGWRMPNGIDVRQVTSPFGVMGMIYESRPNVTVDAAALAIKAGSAVILRGSSSAMNSNMRLADAMRRGLGDAADAVQLIASPDRALVTELLHARGKVDLVIPRGGESLIRHVVDNARVPVIETGTGNCHVYVDAAADLDMALSIVLNSKLQRPGVCNATESLLVHRNVAEQFLGALGPRLRDAGVELRADPDAMKFLPGATPVAEEDWATEYLDLILAVGLVDGVDQAIEHIGTYGTGHSEVIVTADLSTAGKFQRQVDAAVVYVNASSRFTDGQQMGFGAEIGISTQKMHARGPVGLEELVSSRYLAVGEGQIRP